MWARARRITFSLLLCGLAVIACGCAKKPRPVYPVTGQVVAGKDKKPAVGAIVFFNPVEKRDGEVGMPIGTVGADGEYALTTRVSNDGAPAGDYIISIVWPTARKSVFDADDGDRLRGAFADESKSRLRFTVQPGPHNEVPMIELP